MLTWLNNTELPIALFFYGTFATGATYLWTGYGNITWNGHTWNGIGTLGSVSTIDEGTTVEAKGISVSLSGIDSTMLSNVLTEFVLGEPMGVYVAGFNGGSLIADPILSFAGRMDEPMIDVDGSRAVITINCESRLIDMNVAVDRRYTADDQQRDWPGDLGFNFVNSIQEITIYWGSAPTNTGNI